MQLVDHVIQCPQCTIDDDTSMLHIVWKRWDYSTQMIVMEPTLSLINDEYARLDP